MPSGVQSRSTIEPPADRSPDRRPDRSRARRRAAGPRATDRPEGRAALRATGGPADAAAGRGLRRSPATWRSASSRSARVPAIPGSSSASRAHASSAGRLCSTSALVILPPAPLPSTVARSTPSCSARWRTTGETRAARAAPACGRPTGVTSPRGRDPACCGRRGGVAAAARAGALVGHRRARTCPPAPLRPRCTRSSSITPLSKISTSIVDFSVSTTATMSPAVHHVTGLHEPLGDGAGVHVGAERGHLELAHSRPQPP